MNDVNKKIRIELRWRKTRWSKLVIQCNTTQNHRTSIFLGKTKFQNCLGLFQPRWIFGTTTHNVVVNMVVIVTMRSKSVFKHKVFKDREPLKSKNMAHWKEEKCLRNNFTKTIEQMQNNDSSPIQVTSEPLTSS
jgi:hypothetical protein